MRFLEFVPPTLTCVILPILPYNWIILIWHDGIPITVNKITFFGNYGKDERNIEKKQKTLATFCLHNFIFTESQNWSSGLSLECLQTLPIYNSILTRKVVMKLYFFVYIQVSVIFPNITINNSLCESIFVIFTRILFV